MCGKDSYQFTVTGDRQLLACECASVTVKISCKKGAKSTSTKTEFKNLFLQQTLGAQNKLVRCVGVVSSKEVVISFSADRL